jgi:ABC-type uncharacterized transport system substrate-binding protein
MIQAFQRLWLGLLLICAASAILLLSDTPRAQSRSVSQSGGTSELPKIVRVALFQMASQVIIDDGTAGLLQSLKESGFVDGQSMKLSRFNAEGDVATSNAIAQELVGGDYDLLITLTTSSLQAVANANKQRKTPHVFGMVSDPVKAGVGIGTEPLDHPAHLVGIGTFPPVDQALVLARKLNPKLTRIGLAWNPAEVNSEVCTKAARKTCQELGIELLEANVENTSAVREAVASVIDRQAEALLIGGDVTMLSAIEVVAKIGRDANVPVFTCIPGNAAKGALFDVGANYFEVGRTVGRVAARVLQGESIAKIPVEIAIPPKLFVNTTVLKEISNQWSFPADVLKVADTIISETGRYEKPSAITAAAPAQTAAKPLTKRWELRMLAYVNSPDVEETEKGVRDGLKKSGLIEGRDYVLKAANAQGDMSALNGMVDAALGDHADLLLTISSSALQSCVQRAKGTSIVFTMVANPFIAGVGKSDTDHLKNVTGAYGSNDVPRMMPIIKQLMPNARRIGALYAPNEVNSVYSYELVERGVKTSGYELLSLGIHSASEAPDATQSLCDKNLDLICLPNSNLAASSYPTIAQTAARAKIPIFGFLGSMAKKGAVVVLTRDYYDMGVDSGQIAARVIRGEPPESIPFHQCTASKLFVNPAAAAANGLHLPEAFIKSADQVIGQ